MIYIIAILATIRLGQCVLQLLIQGYITIYHSYTHQKAESEHFCDVLHYISQIMQSAGVEYVFLLRCSYCNIGLIKLHTCTSQLRGEAISFVCRAVYLFVCQHKIARSGDLGIILLQQDASVIIIIVFKCYNIATCTFVHAFQSLNIKFVGVNFHQSKNF